MGEENKASLEDLQAQLVKLKQENELLKTKTETLEKSNKETNENLEKARKLNADLILSKPVNFPDDDSEEEPEDTIDSIVDDIVTKTNENYLKVYKNGTD